MTEVSTRDFPFEGYIPPPGNIAIYPSWVKGGSSSEVRDWRGLFVDTTGSTTSGIAEAIALITELDQGGGTIVLGAGTYNLSGALTITQDNIEIVGQGSATVIQSTTAISPGIINFDGASNVSVRNLKFLMPSATAANSALYIESGTTGETTDIEISNLIIEQEGDNGSGVIFANNGATWKRIKVSDCYVEYTGSTPTGGAGINTSAGNNVSCEHLMMENVVIDGFFNAFESNTNNGFWHDCQFVNCVFKNADKHGGWFRHMGEVQVSNCLFEGNGAGALFDNGGANQGDTISNCRFIGNGIGAYTEEWAENTISNCIFEGNTYGFWLASGRNIVVSGCTIANSTNWGMSTDRKFSVTIGANTYSISFQTQHENITMTGCNIHDNGEDGVIVSGVRGTCRIGESFIGNNGQDGVKASSGFSEIFIEIETGATRGVDGNSQQLVIEGNVFGNQKTASPTNGSQYGIRSGDNSHGDLNIAANYFQDLNTPISIAGSQNAHVADNLFIICDSNITIPSTTSWTNNRVRGGNLETSQWDDQLLRTLFGTATMNLGSIAAGAHAPGSVTVTGAAVGDQCVPGHTGMTGADLFISAYVSSADTVTVNVKNEHASASRTVDGTCNVRVYKT